MIFSPTLPCQTCKFVIRVDCGGVEGPLGCGRCPAFQQGQLIACECRDMVHTSSKGFQTFGSRWTPTCGRHIPSCMNFQVKSLLKVAKWRFPQICFTLRLWPYIVLKDRLAISQSGYGQSSLLLLVTFGLQVRLMRCKVMEWQSCVLFEWWLQINPGPCRGHFGPDKVFSYAESPTASKLMLIVR